MTELEREEIVEQMFPDWVEHLNDGKVLDNILKQVNRCGARSGSRKRSWKQRKAAPKAKKLQRADGPPFPVADSVFNRKRF
jgi:hypothetical protein